VKGEPARIGVWIITQLKEPAGLFAPVPKKSIFPGGFVLLGPNPPPTLTVQDGLVSLARNPKASHKIGLDADTLLWVGQRHVLRIDSPRVRGAEYPDQGSNTEIYTNPDPLAYIELETLGPLRSFQPGDRLELRNTYTLSRRTRATPEAQARATLR
jgi:hypothetical protein